MNRSALRAYLASLSPDEAVEILGGGQLDPAVVRALYENLPDCGVNSSHRGIGGQACALKVGHEGPHSTARYTFTWVGPNVTRQPEPVPPWNVDPDDPPFGPISPGGIQPVSPGGITTPGGFVIPSPAEVVANRRARRNPASMTTQQIDEELADLRDALGPEDFGGEDYPSEGPTP